MVVSEGSRKCRKGEEHRKGGCNVVPSYDYEIIRISHFKSIPTTNILYRNLCKFTVQCLDISALFSYELKVSLVSESYSEILSCIQTMLESKSNSITHPFSALF